MKYINDKHNYFIINEHHLCKAFMKYINDKAIMI